ncbi:bifunctional tRNA (5-methylaminomethyl-2-thiouridine)(34)-methyltransferase MnmD/FAD-dependent 5-carboxymethylaminomethyl-2-thiouridine(34) oxidoreductase MnmC [Pseudomonas matsuisoli]|uniref:tRNA 5-methylaminomethyl-2-thiouridine biosynthesis bifunctional protein MnmC n=1 Tax=Pseudomonas matsuisoli TaxID=1515666 RepID=A0A917PSQ1_9PSED|nr:bifunctional tRNA (5-methylaminomethyl-2-thiouridine)(34)-methyltransferase MnmD/FAD-dependent 5-carboxymethylaminomethyl-2-thiouridine(34) oxidoreductase MnmC [Pseudomonas matsuisoli]GGJ89732.1 tRNA 5-methylaminomethyl-2-thiouridine biosynthesis bifunctional protein MnmC [Pseudomonas matsuisoli]
MSDIQRAEIDWDSDGLPRSRAFGDIYFSKASGLDETRHVFLSHNTLAERFSRLHANDIFTIGETGFGTGLNFLCAWQAFEVHAKPGARLHFISAECFPLTRPDLERALALWPELAAFSGQLLSQYQAVHTGFQRFVFDNGRVTLTLIVDDVQEAFPALDARVDAWFLDGFAPAKNPDMWSAQLFNELGRLSAPGATLATFTCAGFVRRGLVDAGFAMRKVRGFGHKREMLAGQFTGAPKNSYKPWYARPTRLTSRREAVVIGAGLAGCATARSLANRGWSVTLIERHATVAAEASGNPQGVLYLKLSAHGTSLTKLVVDGFCFTRRLLERLHKGQEWDECGVLQLAFDNKETRRHAALAERFRSGLLQTVDAQTASSNAGVELAAGGLFFPEAGWVHPPALCRTLLDHPSITVRTCTEALSLSRKDSGDWQVAMADTSICAPVVIIASAADSARFCQTAALPLKRIRGQISYVPRTTETDGLKTVVCAEGYVAPAREGLHTLGASFEFNTEGFEPSEREHRHNLHLLEEISPPLRRSIGDLPRLEGRVAYRCTSPDYLPIVGPLADNDAFAERYAALARDARQVPDAPCPWLDGLYVNTAHGSRGLITAPLSGELLAAWLENEPLPIPRTVAEACHPNRFVLRRVVRGTN